MHATQRNTWRRGLVWLERVAVMGTAIVVLSACSEDDPTGPEPVDAVAYVEIVPEDLMLIAGDTATLVAKLFGSDGSELTGRAITWSSSSPQFATVDANGRVRGVAPGGPVLISATSEGKTGPAFVVVVAANPVPVVDVLDPATVIVGSGPTSVTILGSGFTEGAEVRWNGSTRPTRWLAAGVLEVDLAEQDLAAVGAGEIRVFNPSPGGGLSGPIVLTVGPALVASVELVDFQAEIDAGAVRPLAARALDALGRPVENRPVQWTTGDESIASVTPSGVLMGHASGKTTVRAEIDGHHAEAELTVRTGAEPVAYVFVEPYELVALVGHTATLTTLVLSTSGAEIVGRPVEWTSLDPSVVQVDHTGRIMAVGKGTTRVRAMVGGKEGWARIEVRQYPAGPVHLYDLRLDPLVIFPAVGDTTWMVSGQLRTATLHLVGGTFEVDRSTDRYRLNWTLGVSVPGVGFVGNATRNEIGSAVRYSRSPTDYGYVVTPDGGVAFEAAAGLGDLIMRRSVGGIDPYPFHFVIR